MKEVISYQDMAMLRESMKVCVKCLYDYQATRIRIANRLGKKADGTDTKDNGTRQRIDNNTIFDYVDTLDATRNTEQAYVKSLDKLVKNTPEWQQYLKDVKGIGPQMAAILISMIDIEKATTVSKIWQYCGFNPGEVYGKKKSGDQVVVTTTLIRGDRPTAGFLLPYNKFLRSKLQGVLSTSLMKNPVYKKFYDDYKNRLSHSEKIIEGCDIRWCDAPPIRRDKAARRYMLKMFLIDYYKNVRAIYGMEVRPPYQEEYLGHVHIG